MERTKRITALFMLLTSVLVTACTEGVPSSSYSSNEIYPNITAVETQNGDVVTTVVLEPDPDTGKSVYLSGGDTFYAALNTPPSEILRNTGDIFSRAEKFSSRLKIMQWRATAEYFATDNTAGLNLPVRAYVAFERGSGVWTGETWIDLPSAFTILNPDSDSALSRSQPITLSWSDVDDRATMTLESETICLGSRYPKVIKELGADTGSAQLSDVDYFPPSAQDVNCRVAFRLKRFGPTKYISTELGLGSLNTFQGIQERTVEFTSTP